MNIFCNMSIKRGLSPFFYRQRVAAMQDENNKQVGGCWLGIDTGGTFTDFVLFDACGEAKLVLPPGCQLDYAPGTKLSLIPAPEATGIRSTNLRYPLSGIDLRLGGRDAISNEITALPAAIEFASGALLIYRQRTAGG